MRNYLSTLVLNTPLVRLRSITSCMAYMKLEFMNLGGSIKFRVAYEMIKDLAKNISLKNKIILEASGGNTAIGLAILSKYFDYKLKCVVPDNYPKSKIEQLQLYDAEVILSDHTIGLNSHILKAQEIAKENPNYIYIDQFSNTSNPKAHYFGTAMEIINNLQKVDYFLTGIGSGGTITGVGKRLKEEFDSKIIGVLPQGYNLENPKTISHPIVGVAIGVKPKVLDLSIIDEYIYINEEDLKEAFLISKKEGLFIGVSSLANLAALLKLQKSVNKKDTIVTVSQDGANSYLDYLKGLTND